MQGFFSNRASSIDIIPRARYSLSGGNREIITKSTVCVGAMGAVACRDAIGAYRLEVEEVANSTKLKFSLPIALWTDSLFIANLCGHRRCIDHHKLEGDHNA
jgi:hypothetical protein